jgi:hypothetical protein
MGAPVDWAGNSLNKNGLSPMQGDTKAALLKLRMKIKRRGDGWSGIYRPSITIVEFDGLDVLGLAHW